MGYVLRNQWIFQSSYIVQHQYTVTCNVINLNPKIETQAGIY